MKRLTVIAFLFLLIPVFYGQEKSDTAAFQPLYRHGIKYVFKTSANTVFTGFVTDETATFVVIRNRDVNETYELRKTEIVSVRIYTDRESYSDVALGENYHAHTYMIAQSALLFNPEKVSATSHLLLFENIEYSLTENWALTSNTFAFYPITLGVKCAYEAGPENYIGGNLFGLGIDLNNSNSSIIGYGAVAKFTRGNSNANFTVSGGVIGLSTDMFTNTGIRTLTNIPFMGIAFCRRINKQVAVNLEGWHLPGAGMTLAGFGLKLVGNESICYTFGAYTFVNQNPVNNMFGISLKTVPIPYIGLTRNFN